MKYATPLKGDFEAAYLSMPKNRDGHVVSLFYVPRGQLAAYEQQWRDWLAEHPKRLWPDWVDAWAEKRTRELRKAAA